MAAFWSSPSPSPSAHYQFASISFLLGIVFGASVACTLMCSCFRLTAHIGFLSLFHFLEAFLLLFVHRRQSQHAHLTIESRQFVHLTFRIDFLLFDNIWYWVAILTGLVEHLCSYHRARSSLSFALGLLITSFGEFLRGWSILEAGVQFSHEIINIMDIKNADSSHRKLVTHGPYR